MISSSALTGAAALLLIAAGAAKLADPARTAGALAAMGWPASPLLIRTGAATELTLGAATLAIGGPALGMLVTASFLGFALFVMAALRNDTPIGSCGCFGQADTAPRRGHVVVVLLLAAGCTLAAVRDAAPLIDTSWPNWVVAGMVAAVAYGSLVYRGRRQQTLQQAR